ncbi:hypothetical protein BGW38_009115, partial [Lunasporangiospora selenospora]
VESSMNNGFTSRTSLSEMKDEKSKESHNVPHSREENSASSEPVTVALKNEGKSTGSSSRPLSPNHTQRQEHQDSTWPQEPARDEECYSLPPPPPLLPSSSSEPEDRNSQYERHSPHQPTFASESNAGLVAYNNQGRTPMEIDAVNAAHAMLTSRRRSRSPSPSLHENRDPYTEMGGSQRRRLSNSPSTSQDDNCADPYMSGSGAMGGGGGAKRELAIRKVPKVYPPRRPRMRPIPVEPLTMTIRSDSALSTLASAAVAIQDHKGPLSTLEVPSFSPTLTTSGLNEPPTTISTPVPIAPGRSGAGRGGGGVGGGEEAHKNATNESGG